MATLLADNSYGTLASGLAVGDTALSFTSGHGARFPTVSAGDLLYCCILNSANTLEEVIITAHASGSDSATISRAAGATTAKIWNVGDRIEARISKTCLLSLSNATGDVKSSASASAQTGWLACDGTSYTTAAYPSLFASIGYTWGGGAGNFNVPDFRGRTLIGDGTGAGLTARTIGQGAIGAETGALPANTGAHQLTTAEMPSHTHSVNVVQDNGVGGGNPQGRSSVTSVGAEATSSAGSDGTHSHTLGGTVAIMPPSAVIHWLIKT